MWPISWETEMCPNTRQRPGCSTAFEALHSCQRENWLLSDHDYRLQHWHYVAELSRAHPLAGMPNDLLAYGWYPQTHLFFYTSTTLLVKSALSSNKGLILLPVAEAFHQDPVQSSSHISFMIQSVFRARRSHKHKHLISCSAIHLTAPSESPQSECKDGAVRWVNFNWSRNNIQIIYKKKAYKCFYPY